MSGIRTWLGVATLAVVAVTQLSCSPKVVNCDPAVQTCPADNDPDGGDGPPTGARLHGKVWGPGKKFPVHSALVAAFTAPPNDIPDGTYCERCVPIPANVVHTLSGADGSFTLTVPPGGTYYLVTQKGQFRRVRELVAPAEIGDYDIPDDTMTTLPNRKDQTAGDMIPHIALVFGDYDAIQDVFAKVGIGETDGAYGHQWGSEAGVYDVYDNGEAEHHGAALSNLLGNLDQMLQYHVIFFACSYNAHFAFMNNATYRDNLKEYVRRGGKLYVSDYAYTVADMPWPEFVWFTNPFGGCQENAFPAGCNHGPPFDAPSRSMSPEMSAWLLSVDDTVGGVMPNAEFETKENWNTIGGLYEGYIGDDSNGQPVSRMPEVHVEGTWNYDVSDPSIPDGFDTSTYHPLSVSWPFGCGRVLFTTYHTVGSTSGNRHPGFFSQELVLFDLIMELQACQEIDVE